MRVESGADSDKPPGRRGGPGQAGAVTGVATAAPTTLHSPARSLWRRLPPGGSTE